MGESMESGVLRNNLELRARLFVMAQWKIRLESGGKSISTLATLGKDCII